MNRLESVRNVHQPFSLTSNTHNRPEQSAPNHTHATTKILGLVCVVFSLLPVASMMPMWFLESFSCNWDRIFCESGERYATVL